MNCFADTPFFSICCINECETLMRHIEGSVGAPMASPEHILAIVSNLSSYSVDAPRRLSPELTRKAHAIAARHGGQIPVHGRLFAQWLHLAFPHDCPWPHIFEDSAAMSMRSWKPAKNNATMEERAIWLEEHTASV